MAAIVENSAGSSSGAVQADHDVDDPAEATPQEAKVNPPLNMRAELCRRKPRNWEPENAWLAVSPTGFTGWGDIKTDWVKGIVGKRQTPDSKFWAMTYYVYSEYEGDLKVWEYSTKATIEIILTNMAG
eukprot:CAMPEP_0119518662 /NCGR_PEP_ID=MMETSP1344-20130328/35207_1 /TAXON_ID=236787 /ORGANISM="Florenciella parvula, Strain CCMP2471" /LENGTH=127 /DNA_ID=CAMNT_0007556369 /DNA_START=232 /DNA_END=611 /DNA_ORIENTATION=-